MEYGSVISMPMEYGSVISMPMEYGSVISMPMEYGSVIFTVSRASSVSSEKTQLLNIKYFASGIFS
jgi:hypothetical protein